MTASGRWPAGGTLGGTVEDRVMRIVVATMNNAVIALRRAATVRSVDNPALSEHVSSLAQAIAGLTLEALRTWPVRGK